MKKTLWALALAIVAASMPSMASNVIKTAKFKLSDDTSLMNPSIDDSSWKDIDITRPWNSQGYPKDAHNGWYRIHFTPKKTQLGKNEYNQFLFIDLGKVDDVDMTYLNGKLIGQTGRMPSDPKGYMSQWNEQRSYVVPVKDKNIKWDEDNVLVVHCYNGDGDAGMFGNGVTVRLAQLTNAASLDFSEKHDKDGSFCTVSLNSIIPADVKGTLRVSVTDYATGKEISSVVRKVKAREGKSAAVTFPTDLHKEMSVKAEFTADKSGEKIVKEYRPKYILTPEAPAAPRFNTAPVYGVRPGSPIHFRFGVSGDRPMTFSSNDLPAGLKINASNGALSGKLDGRGRHTFTVTATNDKGSASQKFTVVVGDTIALTPPMGWNSWNCWGLDVSAEKVKSSAQALLDKGLADYGYAYINIDDSWEAPERDANGDLLANDKFPDMKGLGEWLHDEGLKFGIYSSPGVTTCGNYLGSIDHEENDARMYNEWGIDYLKYDWCGYQQKWMTEKDNYTRASFIRPYMLMEKYLREQPRDIFYSLCQYGWEEVWKWGPMVDANSWRTTGDITDTWESMSDIGFRQQEDLYPYAAPGHWNDPDMLVVGKVGWSANLRDSRLTPDEQYTHISLWSLLASNMLIGCDLAQLDDFTINLLCNNEVNAVNQDILGKQAKRVALDGDIQVWARPLADGTVAVGFFNLGDKAADVDITKYYNAIAQDKYVGIPFTAPVAIRDLWRQKDLDTTSYSIPSHGVRLLKLTTKK